MDRSNHFNLYLYQKRTFPILLGWATGSVVSGLLWWRSASEFYQGLGSQFSLWGLIDGLIAVFGIQSAKRNHARYQSGEIDRNKHDQQAKLFETIVWVNVILDLGYIIAGILYKGRHRDNPRRRGVGFGVLLQGSFLLIWDILLASFSRKMRT